MIRPVIRPYFKYVGCFQEAATHCIGGYGTYRSTFQFCVYVVHLLTYSIKQSLY